MNKRTKSAEMLNSCGIEINQPPQNRERSRDHDGSVLCPHGRARPFFALSRFAKTCPAFSNHGSATCASTHASSR